MTDLQEAFLASLVDKMAAYLQENMWDIAIPIDEVRMILDFVNGFKKQKRKAAIQSTEFTKSIYERDEENEEMEREEDKEAEEARKTKDGKSTAVEEIETWSSCDEHDDNSFSGSAKEAEEPTAEEPTAEEATAEEAAASNDGDEWKDATPSDSSSEGEYDSDSGSELEDEDEMAERPRACDFFLYVFTSLGTEEVFQNSETFKEVLTSFFQENANFKNLLGYTKTKVEGKVEDFEELVQKTTAELTKAEFDNVEFKAPFDEAEAKADEAFAAHEKNLKDASLVSAFQEAQEDWNEKSNVYFPKKHKEDLIRQKRDSLTLHQEKLEKQVTELNMLIEEEDWWPTTSEDFGLMLDSISEEIKWPSDADLFLIRARQEEEQRAIELAERSTKQGIEEYWSPVKPGSKKGMPPKKYLKKIYKFEFALQAYIAVHKEVHRAAGLHPQQMEHYHKNIEPLYLKLVKIVNTDAELKQLFHMKTTDSTLHFKEDAEAEHRVLLSPKKIVEIVENGVMEMWKPRKGYEATLEFRNFIKELKKHAARCVRRITTVLVDNVDKVATSLQIDADEMIKTYLKETLPATLTTKVFTHLKGDGSSAKLCDMTEWSLLLCENPVPSTKWFVIYAFIAPDGTQKDTIKVPKDKTIEGTLKRGGALTAAGLQKSKKRKGTNGISSPSKKTKQTRK